MQKVTFLGGDQVPLSSKDLEEKFSEELFLLRDCESETSFFVEDNRLKLINNFGTPIFIDIEKELNYHQKTFYKVSAKKQPLGRALGLGKQTHIRVFDVTAGLLSDSLLMLSMGVTVTSFERNPVVQALITNALKVSPLENFFFYPKNIIDHKDFKDCDVIFFDPMYQEVNQKSLPKKEMQAFREFVGKDADILEVFHFLQLQKKRLVMKRSLKAPPIAGPSFIISGKSTAYDVYLPL